MSLTRTVAPVELPITLEEVKDHLRITDATQDAEIQGYINAVVDRLDGAAGILNRALVTQTWVMTLDAFPASGKAIRLPLPPAQSVTSIQYIDTDGATQTLASANYKLLNAGTPTRPAMIEEAFDTTWPSTRDEGEAVTVTWVAGYGARNDVPQKIRHLILLLAADAFRQREVITTGVMENPDFSRLIFQARHLGA